MPEWMGRMRSPSPRTPTWWPRVTAPPGISGTTDTPRPASTIRTMISVLVVSMSTRGDSPWP
jgi:hypothetical protein